MTSMGRRESLKRISKGLVCIPFIGLTGLAKAESKPLTNNLKRPGGVVHIGTIHDAPPIIWDKSDEEKINRTLEQLGLDKVGSVPSKRGVITQETPLCFDEAKVFGFRGCNTK